jgi:long-chain acyl-CoA synthetase
VVIGDQKKYCVALLTLDADEVKSWSGRRGISVPAAGDWPQHADLRQAVSDQVAVVNRVLASFEQIKHFRILPLEFTVEGGEITPSLKVKRKVINHRYADLIDEMYR